MPWYDEARVADNQIAGASLPDEDAHSSSDDE
jgi:hypothetical protein